jgi:hypothetical protein
LVITQAMTRSAALGPLGQADQDRPIADDLDVAALQGGQAEVLDVEAVVVARRRVPELEVRLAEHRMGLVDGGHVVGLPPPGRPVHRIDRDPAIDPARRIAGEQ